MDNILKFASLQIEEEKNDARVQQFVSNDFDISVVSFEQGRETTNGSSPV